MKNRWLKIASWGSWVLLAWTACLELWVLFRKTAYPFNATTVWDVKLATSSLLSLEGDLYSFDRGGVLLPLPYPPIFFYVTGLLIRPFLPWIADPGIGVHYLAFAVTGVFFLYSMHRLLRLAGRDRPEAKLIGWGLLCGFTVVWRHFRLLDGNSELLSLAFAALCVATFLENGRRWSAGSIVFLGLCLFSKQVSWPFALLAAGLASDLRWKRRAINLAAACSTLGLGILLFICVYGKGFVDKTIIQLSGHPLNLNALRLGTIELLTDWRQLYLVAFCGAAAFALLVQRQFAFCVAFVLSAAWAYTTSAKVGSILHKFYFPLLLMVPYVAWALDSGVHRLARPAVAALSLYALAVTIGGTPGVVSVVTTHFNSTSNQPYLDLIRDFRGRKITFLEEGLLARLTGSDYVLDGYSLYDYAISGRRIPEQLYERLRGFDFIASTFPQGYQGYYGLPEATAALNRDFEPIRSSYPGIYLWKSRR